MKNTEERFGLCLFTEQESCWTRVTYQDSSFHCCRTHLFLRGRDHSLEIGIVLAKRVRNKSQAGRPSPCKARELPHTQRAEREEWAASKHREYLPTLNYQRPLSLKRHICWRLDLQLDRINSMGTYVKALLSSNLSTWE